MSLKKLPSTYYTAQQARQVLGITEHAFQAWIRAGKITKYMLPGRKQGAYLKSEIDDLALHIEISILAGAKRAEQLTFRKATLDDLEDELELAFLNFGARAITPEAQALRRAFLETNPDMTYHLYHHTRLAASLNLVPLEHAAIEEFKQGKRGWLFPLSSIRQFEPGQPLECIIIDFMTTTNAPPDQRERYAAHLLRGVAGVLRSWGEHGVEIVSVHAAGTTPEGRRILKNAGFQELGEPVPNRVIYELDISQSDLKLLRIYKEALATWKQEHNAATAP